MSDLGFNVSSQWFLVNEIDVFKGAGTIIINRHGAAITPCMDLRTMVLPTRQSTYSPVKEVRFLGIVEKFGRKVAVIWTWSVSAKHSGVFSFPVLLMY